MCVLSLACLPGGSATTLHSLFFPSAASRKGFPPAKRSNPQCKAALAPSFPAWKPSSLSSCPQSNTLLCAEFPLFMISFYSLLSWVLFLAPFFLTPSFSNLQTILCSHTSIRSLLDPIAHNRSRIEEQRQTWSRRLPFHLSTAISSHIVSCRYLHPFADRYDNSPLKSPGTYLWPF